jgi:uncharacterized protein
MQKELVLILTPAQADDWGEVKKVAAYSLRVDPSAISFIHPIKRSVDARKYPAKIRLKALVYLNEPGPTQEPAAKEYPNVSGKEEVIIIGCGPAGMFAALKLIELGKKPIILERGKDVKSRRRDLAAINKEHIVNPDSNYCFGEGGAGTYSDGKLYTRASKRGSVASVMETLVAHGAKDDILYESHPHIGTNKLPRVVQAMRESIINAGGEVHFNTRVTDLLIKDNRISGVVSQTGDKIEASHVILATGHSARDIYELLHKKEVFIESKPFALGVRVEHSQNLIDSIQYHCNSRGPHLPAASYSVVKQINDRGVFSFCMCPGGFIVPSATAPGEIVVNGMSPSKRDSKFSNSGIVVGIEAEDLESFSKFGPLAGLQFQKEVEQMAFKAGGETQTAPAQRLVDFTTNKISPNLPDCSYQPGLNSAPLHELLPTGISSRLQGGFKSFGQKMKGYYTNDAVIIGIESRTSSPVRIPRDKETLEHPQIKGLYPCGEGAGFAGGIVSAAMDGERVACNIIQTS